MTKSLKISDELSLPLDAATQTFAFIARKGAGKTYAAGKLAECFLDAGVQVVVLDAVGNWWGLRLSADGKESAYDIPVLGGLRGDIPLESAGGHLIADIITETGRSLIVDISQFSKADRQKFATAFAERLWRSKKAERHPSPVHLIIEESQLIVPEKVSGDTAKMVGIYEEIIRLGRNYGIGVSMITQRPQSVNKEVLNMTECLFVLQVNGAHERKSLKDWITYHGVEKGLADELPTLPVGTAYVWSPQWLQILQKVRIGQKKTFDASATPRVGSVQVRRDLKALDLADLETRMAATIERAKQEDPKELRRQIAELKKQVARPAAVPPTLDSAAIERVVQKNVAVATREFEQRFNSMERQYEKALADLRGRLHKIAALASVNGDSPHTPVAPIHPTAPPVHRPAPSTHKSAPRPTARPSEGEQIAPAKQRILNGLAFLEGIGVPVADKTQLALIVGASPTSGGYFNNLGSLRSDGLIEYPAGGSVALTDAGRAIASTEGVPSTTSELHSVIRQKLPPAKWRILEALIDIYPDSITKSELAESIGVSATSGGYFNNLGSLRSLGLIDYPQSGQVAALSVLFLEER